MSFLESVVGKTKKIERLLEENYQAVGKGLHEKATSVENKLDLSTFKQIRFIATIRNRLMHEDGYRFDGSEREFLDKCDAVINRLNTRPTFPPPRTAPQPAPFQQSRQYVPKPRSSPRISTDLLSKKAHNVVTYFASGSVGRDDAGFYQGGLGKVFSSTLRAILLCLVLYPVVGIVGCLVRVPTQGAPPSSFGPEHEKWLNNPPLNSFTTEAVYIPLFIVAVVFTLGLIDLFKLKPALRVLLIIVCLFTFSYVGKTIVDSMNLKDKLTRQLHLE